MRGPALLFSEMVPDPEWEDRFNRWYDQERLPARLALPGFLAAQRYADVDALGYLAIYDLESTEALQGEGYRNLQEHPNVETRWMLDNVNDLTRYIGNRIADHRRPDAPDDLLTASYLYAVFFSVPDDRAEEFNRWYDTEHAAILLKCPDWAAVVRYEIEDGDPEPWTHLALHFMTSDTALESPEREEARNTEWRTRLAEETWFRASARLYERLD